MMYSVPGLRAELGNPPQFLPTVRSCAVLVILYSAACFVAGSRNAVR